MNASILTLTMNPALDLFLEVEQMMPGTKLRCTKPLYAPGGGGINVSRAIRRLGGDSIALFPAGGSSGEMLVKLLERESITTDVIHAEESTRQSFNVLERSTGNEYRLIVPGPKLGIDEWKHCLRALQAIDPPPDYVVASGSLPPGVPVDFLGRVASLARERHFRLIVDTSGEALRHIAKGTFLLKTNVSEIAYASSEDAADETFIEQAARAIVAAGRVENVVVSLGAGGAILVDAKGARRFAAPKVHVVSRIGAGDSMVAGIALALARNWPIDDAVQYGVAAGTAAVVAASHQLCSLEDTDRLYARQAVTVAV